MVVNETVTLSSNGKYWQAFYYDSMGRRRAKSLGPKRKLSKRKAKVLCDRFAAELNLAPGKADANRPIRLDELVNRYLQSRTDLRETTRDLHRLTIQYLKQLFGGEMRIDRITRAMASDWRSAMARGKLSLGKSERALAEASVCIHVRNARTIFNHAVRDDLIIFNPFDRLKGTAPEPDKDWKYVTIEELDKLLDASPAWGWKILIALCRLAGLRRGEALELTWAAVDWQERRLVVIAQKTGRRRILPIQPKLYELLLDAFGRAEEGENRICSVSSYCLWRNFQAIRKRAGLEKWKDAFQVLRRNCETDWAQEYPQYAVSKWIGHDIKVSARHYLQIPEDLYNRAAATNAAQTATKTATKSHSPENHTTSQK
ncbi:MAG: tyrosine-type recombinase/integrase [Planctomycetes bacterium]|nr:tyrosine-type recombinase/integrase [Planctomycetota bacterium]